MNATESAALEKGALERAIVAPRWLKGSNSIFWYKRALHEDKYQFMLVDCEKGTRAPAFDHEALASALSAQTGQDLDAEKLPFHWINPDLSREWVRFRFQDATYNFSKQDGLETSDGDFDVGRYDINRDVKTPTPRGTKGQQASLTIANQTSRGIAYYWINHEGNSDWWLGVIRARESKPMGSPLGYRLKLVDSKTKEAIALEYKQTSGIVNIEDTPDGLALRWEDDPLADVNQVPQKSEEKKPTPEYEIFTRKHNIWSHKNGVERQVSFGGFEQDTFKTVSATPDGRYAVGMQIRAGSPFRLELKQAAPDTQLRPLLRDGKNGQDGDTGEGKHVRAGDHMATSRPRLFDVERRCEISTDDSLFRNPFTLHGIGWSECGTKYRFVFNERGHKHVRLLEMTLDGKVKVLVEESSDTVVDYHQKLWYKIVPDTRDIFWASERDGWNHIYRFDLESGTLKNQVTKGEWVVRSVEFIDIKAGQIWFKVLGYYKNQDPYYPHLACVDFDGANMRVLTLEDGAHLWRFGPDRRFLIDSWSRVDLLPHVAVIEVSTGAQKVLLQEEQLTADEEQNYVFPERFVSKGRDGQTDIYGIIVRPSNFDPTKSYPVIERIYAHPFQFSTPKDFKIFPIRGDHADDRYVVVMLDGMGTNWRSKAFLDVSYKNMRDAGFPDRIAWMRAAAATRPWMDLSRVGIIGGSAGGQNAAAAVIHHGDFYKAAVAESANHDNRLGTAKWEEMYMSWPLDASYEDNANGTHAGKLRGALMITTGEMDDVVDPASTLQFADALVKADKEFELVIVPGQGHHVQSPWYDKKVARFFKRYLLDGEGSPNAETEKF